jgi:hypothetical protein
MNRKLAFTLLLFVVSVFVLTRIDYFVNSDMYQYGLIYSNVWFIPYQILYFLLYQMVITFLYLSCRDNRFLIVTEAFVLSGTQDILYFVTWGGGMPSPSVQWWWTLGYVVFGFWNTVTQVVFSLVANVVVVVSLFLLHRRVLPICRGLILKTEMHHSES